MIERYFSLNLQETEVFSSNVSINQGNSDSVYFIFKIFDGVTELDYGRFSSARVTFSIKNKAVAGCICEIRTDSIACLLPGEALWRHGVVTGQLDIKIEPAGNLSTNYFNFNITPSLAILSNPDRRVFINEIEQLLLSLEQSVKDSENDAQELSVIMEDVYQKKTEIQSILTEITTLCQTAGDSIDTIRSYLNEASQIGIIRENAASILASLEEIIESADTGYDQFLLIFNSLQQKNDEAQDELTGIDSVISEINRNNLEIRNIFNTITALSASAETSVNTIDTNLTEAASKTAEIRQTLTSATGVLTQIENLRTSAATILQNLEGIMLTVNSNYTQFLSIFNSIKEQNTDAQNKLKELNTVMDEARQNNTEIRDILDNISNFTNIAQTSVNTISTHLTEASSKTAQIQQALTTSSDNLAKIVTLHNSAKDILQSLGEIVTTANGEYQQFSTQTTQCLNSLDTIHSEAIAVKASIDEIYDSLGSSDYTYFQFNTSKYENCWRASGELHLKGDISCCAIKGKKAYVFGLGTTSNTFDSMIYDLEKLVWEFSPPSPKAAGGSAACAWGDKIYVVGGSYNSSGIQIFNTTNNTWTLGADISPTSMTMTENCAVAYNGKIYSMGGHETSYVKIYDIAANTWTTSTEAAPFVLGKSSQNALVYNDKIYFFGGGAASTQYGTFTPSTGKWNLLGDAPINCLQKAAILTKPGIVIIPFAGSQTNKGTLFYDILNDTWSLGEPSPQTGQRSRGVFYDDKAYMFFAYTAPASVVQTYEFFPPEITLFFCKAGETVYADSTLKTDYGQILPKNTENIIQNDGKVLYSTLYPTPTVNGWRK